MTPKIQTTRPISQIICSHSANYAKITRKVCLPLKAWVTTITFLLLTVFTLPVFAATYYVATTGSDSNNGSSGSPYKTIKKAAEVVSAGDIVLVREGTYVEDGIQPRVSGTADAMIVFKPEPAAVGKVIIKYNDSKYTTGAASDRAAWLANCNAIENGWTTANTSHYTDADIRYSNENYVKASNGTDVFNLYNRNYIWIEGFIFRDYKYARNTINIQGTGNVVINNQFINIGTVHAARWAWIGDGCLRGDVTLPVVGKLNVVRNNYFQSVVGETLCYSGGSQENIITENTFIGGIGKNGNWGGSDASTLGGRFENNKNNAFAFNYAGGSVNGYTIWLDVCVYDFTALRNVAHNSAGFLFNESGCTRNWAYENIVYNVPRGANNRMTGLPAGQFTDFAAQYIESGLFTAFWDTGSTWDARWVGNVTCNLKNGINIERSWRDEVRNNIGYEDANTQHMGESLGLRIFETAVVGFHSWHGLDLKGGGPQIIKNNLWYSAKKGSNGNFVRYMYPTQAATTVTNFNAMINSTTELGVDPMFENAAAYDFRLKAGSPAKGTGYNGVDRGAYAVYPKTDVGYNKNLGLTEDVNVSFSQLNSSVKPGNTVSLEIKLNKPATKAMSFKIEPVAGDARLDADFRFVDNQTVTFAAGERTKTVRVEILANPQDEIDQLLALRILPAGTTKLEEVGARNLHLMKIIRVTKYSVTLNDVGDSMGQSIVQYYKPGETVTIDAKTRPNYTFSKWNTGYHYVKQPLANANSARTTFTMPESNVTLRAEWNLVGTKVAVTGVTMSPTTLSLAAGSTSSLTGTVNPTNATDKAVLWTSSNTLVATVSPTGVVTAVSAGTATITVTALDSKDSGNNYKKATCTVTVTGTSVPPITGATMRTDGFYAIKNVNSGRYLDVEGNTVASGSNVVQGGTAHNFVAKTMWKLTASPTTGYYFMRSVANENLVIDVAGESAANGANIGLWTFNSGNNQQFKFVQVSTNTYTIRSRITNDASGLDVEAASMAANGNVLQWTIGTGTNQQWVLEFYDNTPTISLTPATATFPAANAGYATRPAAQTFTVTNTSMVPVATGTMTVALSGTNASSFTLSTTSLASIATQNGTSTFTVQPNLGLAAGTYTATVTVSGTGLTSKTATVTFVVNVPPLIPATMRTDGFYTIKNVNSNRYLEIEGCAMGSGTNVIQGVNAHNFLPSTMWQLKDAGNGYYTMHSVVSENFALDVFGAVPDNGANINMWTSNSGNNQQFKFIQVSEGVYTIRTRISNDASCVEVEGASMAAGGNVLQWVVNGGTNQSWVLEFHDNTPTATQLHDFKNYTSNNDATCTATGTETGTCSRCGGKDTRIKVGSQLEHNFEWKITTEATCEKAGEKTEICSKCPATRNVEPIAKLPEHAYGDWSDWETVEYATCTTNGSQERTRSCTLNAAVIDVESEEIPATGHSYTSAVTAPTCEEEGYTTYTCVRGDHTYFADIVAELGHKFENYTSDENATCEEDGTETGTCSRCTKTDTRTEAGSKLEHNFIWKINPDNDTEEIEVCSICGEPSGAEPKLITCTHDFEWKVTVEATCKNAGMESEVCTLCGVENSTKPIDKLKHIFGEWSEETAATCTEKGEESRTCTLCSTVETQDILKLNCCNICGEVDCEKSHVQCAICEDYDCEKSHKQCEVCSDWDCNKTYGWCEICQDYDCGKVHVECPVCNDWDCEKEHIKCLICGEWDCGRLHPICKVCGAVDCEKEHPICDVCGDYDCTKTHVQCEVCGDWDCNEIHCNHEFEWEITKTPTCGETGSKTEKCLMCGKQGATESIDKLEHNFSDWEEKIDASCTELGTKIRTCLLCKETETHAIPQKEHTFNDWVTTKEATCGEAGSKIERCSVCGKIGENTEVIPATGEHTFELQTIIEPSCRNAGKQIEVCSACGEIGATVHILVDCIPREVTVINGTSNENIYFEGEKVTITADSPGRGYVFKQWSSVHVEFENPFDISTTFIMPAHNVTVMAVFEAFVCTHIFDQWEITKPATCGETGSRTEKCSVCGTLGTITEVIPATSEHDFVWTVTTAPTCKTSGWEQLICSKCNAKGAVRPIELDCKTYTVTVIGGYSDKNEYFAGETVEIDVDVILDQFAPIFKQWTSNDVVFANANQPSTTFIMPAHNVTVTAEFETVGIETIAGKAVKIYPNPVKDKLKIDASTVSATGQLTINKIEIVNFAGRTVETWRAASLQQINVSNLPQGVYIIKMYTNDSVIVRRFVKE